MLSLGNYKDFFHFQISISIETLNKSETASECFCLSLNRQDSYETSYRLGEYYVEWSRSNNLGLSSDDLFVRAKAILPEISVKEFPLSIETITPPFSLEENEFFSIAGDKMVKIPLIE